MPLIAYAPAWSEGRLLGPGDGAALHYPLRWAVWQSWARGEVPSWNPGIFSGTPLLAAYRPGALYPPMLPLAALPPFHAFQVLVLASLAAAGIATFLYVRRLGADLVGAYVSGLSFSLGPYLVGHLADTATVVAAPLLPLVLLAAEAHLRRDTPARAVGLASALALLLLAGSPDAARAGAALLFGRVVVGYLLGERPAGPTWPKTAAALALGTLLAAPQLLPTLVALPEAGRQVAGLAPAADTPLPGLTGLVLRYVSHTPAAALALAALPLALTQTPVRVLGLALGLCLALQWGRGPLSAPGALALVFDLTLAVLGGLSLSAQWQARREPAGQRLRAYFLSACLACAAALSVSAAALGPLPETLTGCVGVLALAVILYFAFAADPDPVKAGLWLLPLTVSFLLQPHGRNVWRQAPTRAALERGTPTRRALEAAMGRRVGELSLTLAREWPQEAADLAYANLGLMAGRRSANGYDPMVPLRSRSALEGMGPAGTLSNALLRSDPRRLEILGLRWVQVPASALVAKAQAGGLGDVLDVPVEPGRPRFFPTPVVATTELRLVSFLSDSVAVADEEAVARVSVRLASGRDLPLWLRAGRDTAEWSHDRSDVRSRVAHRKAPLFESWPDRGGGFQGHRYLGILPLPGRYLVDGLRIERLAGAGRLTVSRLALADAVGGRVTPLSSAASYVSDTALLRETAATPAVRLFELPGSPGQARVVERLRVLPDDTAVLRQLGAATLSGLDPRRETLATEADAASLRLPPQGRASRAEVVRAHGGRLEVRAEGPGLLVLAEGYDPGWSASVDGAGAQVIRVNHAQLGIPLGPGTHRVGLRHLARGFWPGCAVAALAASAAALRLRPGGRRRV